MSNIFLVKPLNSYQMADHCAISIWIDEISKFGDFDVFNPRIIKTNIPYLTKFSIIRQLIILILRSKKKVIVVHNDVDIFRILRLFHKKVIYHAHNDYSQRFKTSRYIDNGIVVCSQYLKDKYKKYFGPIHIIPNGVTAGGYETNRKRIYDVLYVGRLNMNKNFDGFIKFCESIGEKQKILVIGIPFSNLESSTTKVLSKSVHDYTFTGSIPHKQVIEYMKVSNVLWHFPLYDEAFGMVVLEAYANGCKLLVRDFKGISFVLQELQIKGYQLDDEMIVEDYIKLSSAPNIEIKVPDIFTWENISIKYQKVLSEY